MGVLSQARNDGPEHDLQPTVLIVASSNLSTGFRYYEFCDLKPGEVE